MQCPLCLDSPLEPKFVGATEVDICPRCRGIWLDRGELDRLVGDAPARDHARAPRDGRRDDRRDDRPHDRDEARRDDRDRARDHRPRGKQSRAKRLADLFEDVLDF